jgi:hypothetical protein
MKITNCSYALNPGTLNVTAGPQTRIVTVQTTAGCSWSATPNPFVSIQGPSSGTGPGTVTFAFAANPGLARTGSVTVAGQTIPVNQGGSVSANCSYVLSSAGASVPYTGTASAVTLTTTGTCAWQGYSSTSWLQLFPLGGTGTSSLSYTVFPNFRPTARQATITAGGQTFTVNQDANPLNADQRFVQLIYFSFFGRLPSTDELDLQVNQGLGTAKDYAGLAMGFLNSLEFNLGGRFVAGLYVGLLDRNAEFGGWQFQRDAKGRGDISPQAMVNNFLSSGEYTLRFGHPDNQEFVRLLYRYILRREATPQEVTNQSNRLQPQGTMTRADLAYLFLNSDEFRQKLDARLTAFLLYATLLLRDASPDEMALRMGQLANATPATVKQIVGEIIQSPEFKLVVGWP